MDSEDRTGREGRTDLADWDGDARLGSTGAQNGHTRGDIWAGGGDGPGEFLEFARWLDGRGGRGSGPFGGDSGDDDGGDGDGDREHVGHSGGAVGEDAGHAATAAPVGTAQRREQPERREHCRHVIIQFVHNPSTT